MSQKSTPPRRRRKAGADRPPKPYTDFPLCPHASGSWQKKIRGRVHYFGKWGRRFNGKLERLPGDGWQEALEQYNEQKDDLFAGRTPRVKYDGLVLKDLCNRFLTAKQNQLETREITVRTFNDYKNTTDRLIAVFGMNRLVDDLAADDFEKLRAHIAKKWGPVRLGNEIQRVRTVFKYSYEAGLIDKPVRYGPQFKKPSKSVLRRHRAANGHRMFEATEIRAMLNAASPPLRAMILLGVNCGFGNSDCGTLPINTVDLNNGWIKYPRPKTGIDRRCPLWPETIAALRAALANRPTPKAKMHANLMFVTKYGEPWAKDVTDSPVTKETSKLLLSLKIKRPGLGFYALRHTFRTIADATCDFPTVRLIMGHADGSIDEVYRDHIDDTRLQAVADHVREWLFGSTNKTKDETKPKAIIKRPGLSRSTPIQQSDGDLALRIFD